MFQHIKTPWGPAQDVTDIGAGILRVDTASHGGYYVPPTLNALIPASWRAASFNGRGMDGWYEEDCDWSMVALAFPTTFPDHAATPARRMFDRAIRPKIEAHPQRPLGMPPMLPMQLRSFPAAKPKPKPAAHPKAEPVRYPTGLCTAACMFALGPDCDCACMGRNHQAGLRCELVEQRELTL